MNRVKGLVWAFVLMLGFSDFVFAHNLGVRTFDGVGMHQLYIPYDFEAPHGNCGQVEVWEYKPAYHFFGQNGFWEPKNPGEVTARGIYRIRLNSTDCDSTIRFEGTINEITQYGGAVYREIEPEEIGLFVKGKWNEENVFGLSNDDRLYSYYLVYQEPGRRTSLRRLIQNCVTQYSWDIVGVVLGDQQGFATKVVRGKQFQTAMKTAWIDEDDFLVLIRKEHYDE